MEWFGILYYWVVIVQSLELFAFIVVNALYSEIEHTAKSRSVPASTNDMTQLRDTVLRPMVLMQLCINFLLLQLQGTASVPL